MAAGATAQNWNVQLSAKQAKAWAEIKTHKRHTAFAISPDGAWGRTWDFKDAKLAKTRAIQFCRNHVRVGKRDCILYSADGKVLVSGAVQTTKITKLYKPVSGRKAAKFFGLVGMSFQGDPAAARAQHEQVKASSGSIAALRGDGALKQKLTGSSIASIAENGFALHMGKSVVRQAIAANSGLIEADYSDWMITKEGLLCMKNGRFYTGKPIGTNCIILHQIANGKLKFAWANGSGSPRNGYIIAGNATYAAAK